MEPWDRLKLAQHPLGFEIRFTVIAHVAAGSNNGELKLGSILRCSFNMAVCRAEGKSLSLLHGELAVVQIGIEPALFQELPVGSLLHDFAGVHD